MPRGGSRPGAGGRNRKSAEEKRALGTYRADQEAHYRARDAARPALEPCTVGEPPEGLDDVETASWRELAPPVEYAGTFTMAHAPAFRILVRTHALLDRVHSERDDSGALRASVASIASLTRVVGGMLARFGLDPAVRGLIRVASAPAPAPAQDDPDDFAPLQVVGTEKH